MSSNSGAKRRSLLANAIDSLDSVQPSPEQEPMAAEAAGAPVGPSKSEAFAPSFLERRGVAFAALRTLNRSRKKTATESR